MASAPLPRGWKNHIKSALLHAISVAVAAEDRRGRRERSGEAGRARESVLGVRALPRETTEDSIADDGEGAHSPGPCPCRVASRRDRSSADLEGGRAISYSYVVTARNAKGESDDLRRLGVCPCRGNPKARTGTVLISV
jgi:hypothetical protein